MGEQGLHGAGAPDHNVWASGAATAAFDAFSDHLPDPAASIRIQSARQWWTSR